MRPITIYTTPICAYCTRAKALLKAKGAAYEEIDVFMDMEARAKMEKRSGGRNTVPQIFIGDVHVGGSDELAALDTAGELDALLGG
ncbi:MAG TPA: glutaredoxin 3 [Rhizomicrobium sp.]|jgi:glutaredoxin 3|nr:glutaredoxin 3 [Rhizomicrobium sp.]